MTDGCPEGMYPLDSDFEDNWFDTFAELAEAGESSSDVLNVPMSWFFTGDEDEDDFTNTVQLVFYMPRKGRTWSMRAKYDPAERAENEQWLKDFTKREMTTWFGCDE